MKKTLSILMSILTIVLSLTFLAGAAGCDCKDHTNAATGCHCCIDCDNLDEHYITSCIKDKAKNGEYNYDDRCCHECTGLIPCTCGCPCCALSDEDLENLGNGNGQIFTPDQQEQIVTGFQKVMLRIREFFDTFFDVIFEFLRFDEIMGNN